MSTIIPNYRTVQDLLQGHSFGIDEYQREYKWERKHVEELLTDLRGKFFSCWQKEHTTQDVSGYEGYFLGSVIVTQRNGKQYLVDGQQRVTTLTLLLIYLLHAATDQGLAVGTNLRPLIYSDNYGKPSFNLDIPERQAVLDALFSRTPYTPDGTDESVQTMLDRYRDIEAIDLAGDLDSALPHFCYWLMNRVGLIEIATDSDRAAYTIFETMNDRGKPLSPVDMLKAYLLTPVTDKGKRHDANNRWRKEMLELTSWGGDYSADRDANCIKAWLRAQYAGSIRERKAGSTDRDWELAGSAFHRWAHDNAQQLGVGTQENNLHFINVRLPFVVRAYRQILDASAHYTPGLEPVFYNAHNEFTWQSTVLLAPLDEHDDSETVRRKVAATATYLDIWIMRRVVNYTRVSYSGTSYAMFLLCRDIRGRRLPDLIDQLAQRLDDDDFRFSGNPERNRLGITDWRLNQFSRRYIFHFLARVTAYVEAQSGGADHFADYVDRARKNSYDIEHIWPNHHAKFADQFDREEEFLTWRDNVAGLLLLPADVNRSYSDEMFAEKAPHYVKQNLYAASLTVATYEHQPQFEAFIQREQLPFKPYTIFGRAEQEERRALVQQLAEKIWSPERLQSYRP